MRLKRHLRGDTLAVVRTNLLLSLQLGSICKLDLHLSSFSAMGGPAPAYFASTNIILKICIYAACNATPRDVGLTSLAVSENRDCLRARGAPSRDALGISVQDTARDQA
jgi:hypothetical protein